MNTSLLFKCLACWGLFLAFGSILHAETAYVVTDADKNATAKAASDVTVPPLTPVPEPSATSLILLGLGGVALGVRLRKRA
jgi:hypothetical protein